jgi:multifunctional 2-oxoglutarate metabolism enzyme
MAIETTTVEVVMPAMGDSVSEGTVLEWHKAEGDSVSADETLVEISTDKVDAEVPAPIDGTVAKVHAAEGDTIHVGAVLAEIVPSNGGAPAAAPEAAPEEAPGETVEIVMPAMGESVSEGVVLEWAKQVGDSVDADETIVEISTDKVDAEVPAPASGTVTEILVEPGETVTVGQVIARMTAGAVAGAEKPTAPEPTGAPRPSGDVAVEAPEGSKITPVAKRVAAAHGIDLSDVHGSGPAGRIGKEDVLAAANGGATVTRPSGATQIKGASAMLVRYMDESRQVPTATSFRTLTVTTLDARRKQLKDAGQRVSFTHLIAYAIARAATEQMPVMAHHFEEIDGKPHVIDDGACNLGIAVDVERKDGGRTLMVPVIRDAGRLSFREFLDAFGDLIAKARENKLGADDLQGANLSLTNPGGIGTIASVPRLMKGQGTLVATGSIGYPPGLAAVGAMIGAEKVMTMTSTYDHRIIQGAESGQFLQAVEAYLQGEHDFYEQVFADLGATLGGVPQPPAPAAAAAAQREAAVEVPTAAGGLPVAPDEALLQAVQAATSVLKAHRMHGHLAAKLDPLSS